MLPGLIGLLVFVVAYAALKHRRVSPARNEIERLIPARVRARPGMVRALWELHESVKDMRAFLVEYRKKNPEIAKLADKVPTHYGNE